MAKQTSEREDAKDLFQSMLKSNESLFLDAIALDFDYLPKLLLHRENQQKYISSCIAPLLQSRSGKNLLITGSPGIGKTAAVRWVLRELEEKYDNEEIQPIYINCWKMNSSFKVLVEMCRQVNYKLVQNKRTDELLDILTERLNDRPTVFVFDEIDKLEEPSVLYSILEDINKKAVILITNEKEWFINLDQRVRSRLTAELLEFAQYNYTETFDILKQRAEFAFVKNAWEQNAFEAIAKRTFELADIRAGLSLLKSTAEVAEASASRKVLLAHVLDAIKKLDVLVVRKSTDLADSDKNLLDFIRKNPNNSMQQIFNIYSLTLQDAISYRTFQRQIKRLKDNKMVAVHEEVTEKGKVFVVSAT